MTLWRTYYHIVWATRDRCWLITPDRELILYPHIIQKIQQLEAHCHAIGGMPDHLHLVVSIPPKIAISEFVKRIKGSSARHLNQVDTVSSFVWQREYGVFSLGSQQLELAIDYVKNQKQRHQDLMIIDALYQIQ